MEHRDVTKHELDLDQGLELFAEELPSGDQEHKVATAAGDTLSTLGCDCSLSTFGCLSGTFSA